jgi:hypothetical protein
MFSNPNMCWKETKHDLTLMPRNSVNDSSVFVVHTYVKVLQLARISMQLRWEGACRALRSEIRDRVLNALQRSKTALFKKKNIICVLRAAYRINKGTLAPSVESWERKAMRRAHVAMRRATKILYIHNSYSKHIAPRKNSSE